jgi:hypothetical protein
MGESPDVDKRTTRFGQPEKRNWRVLMLFWVFVVCATGAIVGLVKHSPKERALECDTSSGTGSLTSWGGCHDN